jgi:four helix bundle protein
LDFALGAASEVEYPLLLARDLGFLGMDAHDHLHAQTTEVKRMLASLLGRLRADG